MKTKTKTRKTKKRTPAKLRSVAAEKKACIAAFKKYPLANFAWCLHHGRLCEKISASVDYLGTCDWQGRVRYITRKKPSCEQAIRFRNFRPVKGKLTWGKGMTWGKGIAQLNREWPDNTWDRKRESIGI